MKLSILICSLFNRASSLKRLLDILEKQTTSQVEVLVIKDNGKMSVGSKRNSLLEKAQGQYICFVDDDDLVSEDYISKILAAIKTEPDCCGIEGLISLCLRVRNKRRSTLTGRKQWMKGPRIQRKFIHSIKYKTWFEKDHVYYRCPNHLNPIKKELALQIGFPNIYTGEDKDYSQRLLPLLKTEVYIEKPIYFYLAS